MAIISKSKKTTTAKRGAAKKRAKWQRDILNPPEIKRTDVVLQFDGAGNARAVTLEEARQYAEELNAADDQVWTEIKAVREKNRGMLGKRARDAMGTLFAWAVATGWCDYGEWISPLGQVEMLECFYDEAWRGIIVEQTPFRKARSVFADKAYEIAKPYLLSFREAQGIPNNQPLTKDHGRQIWPKIIADPKWKIIVRRHAEREFKRLAFVIPRTIQAQMAASSKTLREGVRNRWDDEFSGNNDR